MERFGPKYLKGNRVPGAENTVTMAQTVQIVYEEPRNQKSTFSQLLESRARQLASREERGYWGYSDAAAVMREIALTVEHLDRTRAVNKRLRQDLLNLELHIDTKLMQLWPGKTEHLPYLWRETDRHKLVERDRLQEKLLWIDQERRRFTLLLEDKLRPLHDRLLFLLNRHGQLRRKQNGY